MQPVPPRRLPALLCLPLALVLVPPTLSSSRAKDPERAQPGWVATWTADGVRASDVRGPAALSLGADEVPHPAVPLGAAWTGELRASVRLERAGRWRFGVEAVGARARLSVGLRGEHAPLELSRSVAPAFGPWFEGRAEPLDVRLELAPEGEAPLRVRVLWQLETPDGGGFPPQPIPARAASVPSELAEAAARAELAAEGRALLERNRCARCHAAPEGADLAAPDAPPLDGLAERVAPGWLVRWLAEPSALEPGGAMPDLLGGDEAAARELAQRLLPADVPTVGAEHVEGRRLYHSLGCVACHGALEPPAVVLDSDYLGWETPSADVPAPFGRLGGKWREEALAAFLREPHALRPGGRMPSLDLDEAEAEAVAGYLVRVWQDPPHYRIDELAELGAARWREARCGACHALAGAPSAQPARPLAELDLARGCLDADDRATPRYDLDARQRDALRAGVRAVLRDAASGGGASAPTAELGRRLDAQGCTACHVRDARGGVAEALRPYFVTAEEDTDLGDEGRIPPSLDEAGYRLTTGWLRAVLEDGERARPWLAARMPRFHAPGVAGLAEAFARAEGLRPDDAGPEPTVTDELVLAGRELMGRDALACVTCHLVGDRPPAGTPGLDVTAFAERLRPEGFRAFVRDPQRWRPGSRMPNFATGGTSSAEHVLGGDLERQLDALWAYFTLGERLPLPEGVPAAQDGLPVEVGERPVVLRTFLEDAGSRGIAVGFPVGVHLAFDAGAVRLVGAWQGAFLDASGAWAGRGGNPSGGRGPALWEAPPGPLAWHGVRPDAWPEAGGLALAFEGYRLDAAGVPTFLWRAGEVAVAERAEPRVAGGGVRIVRALELGWPADAREPLWLRPGEARVVAGDAQEVAGPGGEPWLRVAPGTPAVTLEVAP